MSGPHRVLATPGRLSPAEDLLNGHYREAAENTDGAAYADGVSEYAALGWDELREVARAVVAIISGRG